MKNEFVTLSTLLKVQPYQIHRLSNLEFKGILDLIESKSNDYKPHVEDVGISFTKNVNDEPDDIFYRELVAELNVNALLFSESAVKYIRPK